MAECRITPGMSRREKWRGLCACKGRDAFDCQLHPFVRRQRDAAKFAYHAGLLGLSIEYYTGLLIMVHAGKLVPHARELLLC